MIKGSIRKKVIGKFFILLLCTFLLTSCSAGNYVQGVILDKVNVAGIQDLSPTQDKKVATLKELPDYLKMAFVITEDKRFYEHKGVDPKGILRALYRDVLEGSKSEGASTITQQLARNAFLSNEKTLTRKTKEIAYALELERKYSKDQILEMYLNHIYFGSGAYGIQAAAQEYFGKDAKDLTISESALLAGLPKAPSKYSPRNNIDLAKERRSTVLSLMEENHIITKQEEEEANKQEILLTKKEVGQ
ncbi:transglycosylase domain-containing protein [Priestia megaterium]|uniref:transglycosylase domain-containing protein n=1 Tax=Priestia megaterium TaxID=1404 RepID=UPI001B3A6B1F|nr:transglycosylase domain-containing protein [Priestia megaterium]MBQ4869429.1 transglycosylase domain-containing protein [Priestia megaterium]